MKEEGLLELEQRLRKFSESRNQREQRYSTRILQIRQKTPGKLTDGLLQHTPLSPSPTILFEPLQSPPPRLAPASSYCLFSIALKAALAPALLSSKGNAFRQLKQLLLIKKVLNKWTVSTRLKILRKAFRSVCLQGLVALSKSGQGTRNTLAYCLRRVVSVRLKSAFYAVLLKGKATKPMSRKWLPRLLSQKARCRLQLYFYSIRVARRRIIRQPQQNYSQTEPEVRKVPITTLAVVVLKYTVSKRIAAQLQLSFFKLKLRVQSILPSLKDQAETAILQRPFTQLSLVMTATRVVSNRIRWSLSVIRTRLQIRSRVQRGLLQIGRVEARLRAKSASLGWVQLLKQGKDLNRSMRADSMVSTARRSQLSGPRFTLRITSPDNKVRYEKVVRADEARGEKRSVSEYSHISVVSGREIHRKALKIYKKIEVLLEKLALRRLSNLNYAFSLVGRVYHLAKGRRLKGASALAGAVKRVFLRGCFFNVRDCERRRDVLAVPRAM